jgi:hypothetical protein
MMVKQAVYNKSLSNSMFNCVFKAANSSEEGRYFSDDNPFPNCQTGPGRIAVSSGKYMPCIWTPPTRSSS